MHIVKAWDNCFIIVYLHCGNTPRFQIQGGKNPASLDLEAEVDLKEDNKGWEYSDLADHL